MKIVAQSLFILLCLSPLWYCFGQSEKLEQNPQSSLAKYFDLPRESIHLHLNITTYVTGEEIWFSGYVFDRASQKPFDKTTNVHLGVYDDEGKQLDKRLFLSQKGFLKGNILLDSTYVSGNYYLKVSTNWMRNFKEDDSHIIKIKVLDAINEPVSEIASEDQYDIQFLPEGGNLISDIANNVGVKVLNEKGYGVQVQKIRIVDTDGTLATSLSTSKLGMGCFEFIPKRNITYWAEISLPEGVSRYKLPISRKTGINVRVYNNSNHNKIGVVFKTNPQTMDNFGDREFYFLVHKDGISEKIPVNFNLSGEAKFFLGRSDLKKGVNMITLFDNTNTPILERMFFNRGNVNAQKVNINAYRFNNDSISVVVTGAIAYTKTSISVLPQGTLAYTPWDNIVSSFYLKPYLSGFVENPGYYFRDVSERKNFELDVLMLTQGWSRYKWNDVFNNQPENIYVFEEGMQLNLSLNGLDRKFDGKLMLHETEHHGQQLLTANTENNRFLITSFFPMKGEKIYLSVVDRKGKLDRANAYINLIDEMNTDRQVFRWPDNPFPDARVFDFGSEEAVEVQNSIQDRIIYLEEVELTEKKRVSGTENPFIPAYMKNKTTKVDSETIKNFPLFTSLLIGLYGYVIIDSSPPGTVSIRSRRAGGWTQGVGNGLNVVIDGVRYPNANLLYQLPTDQVEEYWVDRLSRYEGALSQLNETLYVFTKTKDDCEESSLALRKTASAFKIKKGFERTKEFYMPKYETFNDKAFEHLGAIHWIPDLELDENGKGEFRILNTGIKDIAFFAEGMSSGGELLLTTEMLTLSFVP